MADDTTKADDDKLIEERFAQLPKIVQDAITSADVEKRLRGLADVHKLHVDQWDRLEYEVQMTLMGFQEPEDLAKNIQEHVGVSQERSMQLAQEISAAVFQPI